MIKSHLKDLQISMHIIKQFEYADIFILKTEQFRYFKILLCQPYTCILSSQSPYIKNIPLNYAPAHYKPFQKLKPKHTNTTK